MRHRITLAGTDEQLWLARDARGYRLELDGGSARVALEALAGPPSSFDRLRMRATERAGTSEASVESLILSLSKDEAFGPATRFKLTINGITQTVVVAVDGDDVYVHIDGAAHHLRYHDPVTALGGEEGGAGDDVARAPMPGTVVVVHVRAGQAVAAGDALLVIESMKLETTIRARHDGAIAKIHVAEGQTFERDAVLVSFEGTA